MRRLAVEQQKVCKGLWRERGALQQEVELLETCSGLLVHVQQSAVVERDLSEGEGVRTARLVTRG